MLSIESFPPFSRFNVVFISYRKIIARKRGTRPLGYVYMEATHITSKTTIIHLVLSLSHASKQRKSDYRGNTLRTPIQTTENINYKSVLWGIRVFFILLSIFLTKLAHIWSTLYFPVLFSLFSSLSYFSFFHLFAG